MKTLAPRFAPPRKPRGWQPDSQRGNRHQRGYGTAWERLRRDVLHRDCGLCQPCLQRGHTTIASQVDHITPKAYGGTDHPDNLQAICLACHRQKTALESSGTR